MMLKRSSKDSEYEAANLEESSAALTQELYLEICQG